MLYKDMSLKAHFLKIKTAIGIAYNLKSGSKML